MTIKKIILGTVITGVFGFAFICGSVFFAPDFVDLNKYKQVAFDAVKTETGYEIKCEDAKIKRSFSPYLNIHLYHSVVLYPDGEVFLKLKESDVRIKLLPLLFKKLSVKDVKLERPVINVYLYGDFSTSFEKFSVKNKKIDTAGFVFDGISSGVICDDYKLNIHDLSIKRDFYAQGEKAVLKEVEKAKKIRVITKGELLTDKHKFLNYDLDIITDYMREIPRFTFSPFKTLYENNVRADIYSHLKTGKNNELFGDLKVENLSLNVDKVLMQKNNLNIKFKGEELSFDSVLHSSKTDEIKLNGKFQYSSKKYADINALAKNINIETFCILLNEITDILNLDNPLREVSVKGILNADFNVKSDFKKLQSSGVASVKNAIIKHKSLPYSLNDINADIDFNNNNILIKNASAKVNSTPVTLYGNVKEDMSFDINAKSSGLDVVNVVKLFGLDKNLPVNITKGLLTFDADIKGILNKKYIADVKAETSGLSFVEKTMKIPVVISKAKFILNGTDKKYNGEINAELLEAVIEKQKLKSDTFKAAFDEKNIIIPSNQITSPAKFDYEGRINDYMTKPSGDISFNGKIPASVVSSVLKNYVKFPNKPSGNISMSGKIAFKDEITALKAKFNADANNYISYMVIRELLNQPSALNIDCVSSKNEITINDISLIKNSSEKIISMNGKVLSLTNPEVSDFKIKIPSGISGNSDFFGGENFSVKGDLTVNGKLSAPDIKGNLKVAKYYINRFAAEIKNADLIFNGNSLKVSAPEISVVNSAFNINADLKHDFKNVIVENMQVHCINFDVSPVYAKINNYINVNELSKLIVKKGSLTVNNAKLASLSASDIAGDFSFNKNTLYLNDITASAYGGRVFGNAEFNLPTRYLKIKAKARNIDIKTSIYDLSGFSDNLSGSAEVDADISLYAGAHNIPLRSLSGHADFTAKNGKAGTLGKFEYYLSAKNIIHKGIMNATLNKIASAISKDDTSDYREAKGSIRFKEGYIISEGIKTSGSKMSLYVIGNHNMLTDVSNLNIYGRISDEIKSKLGNAGDVSPAAIFNTQAGTKTGNVLPLTENLVKEIPLLYNKPNAETSMFSVNISGNIKSVNSIKDFNWIVSSSRGVNVNEVEEQTIEETAPVEHNEVETQREEPADEKLPDFSEI